MRYCINSLFLTITKLFFLLYITTLPFFRTLYITTSTIQSDVHMLRYSKPRNHCHRFEEPRQKQLLFEKRIAYDPQPHETVIVETKAASTTQITHVRSAQLQQLSPIAPKLTNHSSNLHRLHAKPPQSQSHVTHCRH